MARISLHGERAILRSKHSVQTSPKLKAFQACVASQLEGKSFGSRTAVQEAFKKAAHSCKGK